MYYLDHAPPHFHVRYNEARATVRLPDLMIAEGHLPSRVAAMVREWAAAHRDELTNAWQLAQERRPLRKIEPLE